MGPVVAVVGGGQLARMMAEPAGVLQIQLQALVEAEDGATAQVVPRSIVGEAGDEQALDAITAGADVLTFEHEHVPSELLEKLIARGVNVQPGPKALRHAQDKIVMRKRLSELGVPCPRWKIARTLDEVRAAGDDIGWPIIVKTPVGGYDGKGVAVVKDAEDFDQIAPWLDLPRGEVLVEEKVPFTHELAALVARRPSGEVKAWPVVETVQENGVCAQVYAPAPDLPNHLADDAADIAETIATGLSVTGVLAVEMFVTSDGVLLVNELAMRPHNSGHVTIEGCVTSQFEQHLRAVLDLPLGETTLREKVAVMANVLGSELEDPASAYGRLMEEFPDVKVHLYGKGVRPGRKLGHVTAYGDDFEKVRGRALAAAALLRGE